ncbi:hypothetical protein RRF57_009479 [Xylaria bambusicola]|uniref:Uncharacterized protein n=1 Tax=Xylaria bambusicola TaxID=326684 RepID=A0AAN7UJP4_9PEZI
MPDMSQLADNSNINPTASHGHVVGSQPRFASSSQTRSHQTQFSHDSSNNSQATNSTSNDNDRVFTPPESDSESSHRHGNDNSSSQESQLMHLSNLAALQQKIVVSRDDADINGAQSRKRMADGVVKHTRHHSSASPVRMGHSRNTSTVSVASTAGSRIGEVCVHFHWSFVLCEQ